MNATDWLAAVQADTRLSVISKRLATVIAERSINGACHISMSLIHTQPAPSTASRSRSPIWRV